MNKKTRPTIKASSDIKNNAQNETQSTETEETNKCDKQSEKTENATLAKIFHKLSSLDRILEKLGRMEHKLDNHIHQMEILEPRVLTKQSENSEKPKIIVEPRHQITREKLGRDLKIAQYVTSNQQRASHVLHTRATLRKYLFKQGKWYKKSYIRNKSERNEKATSQKISYHWNNTSQCFTITKPPRKGKKAALHLHIKWLKLQNFLPTSLQHLPH